MKEDCRRDADAPTARRYHIVVNLTCGLFAGANSCRGVNISAMSKRLGKMMKNEPITRSSGDMRVFPRIIAAMTIELAHSLGLRVVAEGVEDATTQSLLAALGCDEAQGFHINNFGAGRSGRTQHGAIRIANSWLDRVARRAKPEYFQTGYRRRHR